MKGKLPGVRFQCVDDVQSFEVGINLRSSNVMTALSEGENSGT
jgi:hypothetical protein